MKVNICKPWSNSEKGCILTRNGWIPLSLIWAWKTNYCIISFWRTERMARLDKMSVMWLESALWAKAMDKSPHALTQKSCATGAGPVLWQTYHVVWAYVQFTQRYANVPKIYFQASEECWENSLALPSFRGKKEAQFPGFAIQILFGCFLPQPVPTVETQPVVAVPQPSCLWPL